MANSFFKQLPHLYVRCESELELEELADKTRSAVSHATLDELLRDNPLHCIAADSWSYGGICPWDPAIEELAKGPRLAELALAAPKGLIAALHKCSAKAALAALDAPGVELALLGEAPKVTRGPHSSSENWRDLAWIISSAAGNPKASALCSHIETHLLPRLPKTSQLWLCAAFAAGSPQAIRNAAASGFSLSGLPERVRAALFFSAAGGRKKHCDALLRSRGWHSKPTSAEKNAEQAAIALDLRELGELFGAAEEAGYEGLQGAGYTLDEFKNDRHWVDYAMPYCLLREANKGRCRAPGFLALWIACANLEPAKLAASFGGQNPIAALAQSGLVAAEDWTAPILAAGLGTLWRANLTPSVKALDQIGAKAAFDSSKGSASENYALACSLVESGLEPEAYASAARIGVDFSCAPPDDSLIEKLFFLDRKGAEKTLEALLREAALKDPAAPARLLAFRGKHGSGPLHWAARDLNPQALELICSYGADIMQTDDKGQTAGHWAARKYGEKAAKKVGPTLQKLSELGFDWNVQDHGGASALAALAAKGSLEPILGILRSVPEALTSGASGKTAEDRLNARNDGSASLAQQAVFSASLPDAAPSRKNRKSI